MPHRRRNSLKGPLTDIVLEVLGPPGLLGLDFRLVPRVVALLVLVPGDVLVGRSVDREPILVILPLAAHGSGTEALTIKAKYEVDETLRREGGGMGWAAHGVGADSPPLLPGRCITAGRSNHLPLNILGRWSMQRSPSTAGVCGSFSLSTWLAPLCHSARSGAGCPACWAGCCLPPGGSSAGG